MKRQINPCLALIVLAYLGIGSLYALLTPAWQAPDEPAHYNYVAQVAQEGCCPVITAGDWDNAYLDQIKAAKFAPEALNGRLGTIQYEDHQPPLYYLLLSPIFQIGGGNLSALRLASLLLGLGGVISAWVTARMIVPGRMGVAISAAGFVAFLPQNVSIMASVNNDALAALVGGLILIWCVWRLQGGSGRWRWSAGILIGLALLTKLTIYPLTALIFLSELLASRRTSDLKAGIGRAVIFLIVGLILITPFWVRNLNTYGFPDFLAQSAHDRVVVGQVQTSQYLEQFGLGGWLGDMTRITFQSFWGQFGWMGVPMNQTIYQGLLGITILILGGSLIALIRGYSELAGWQHDLLIVCGTAILLTLGAFLYYNLKFAQFQGRYLYPALIPFGLIFAAGIEFYAGLAVRFLPTASRRLAYWGAGFGVTLGLALFALYALFRIILPAF